MNLLLDTNVIIDYLGRREPFFGSAERVMAAGFFGDVKLWTSTLSLKDAFYVLERFVGSAPLQRSFTKLNEVVSFVSVGEEDMLRALRLEWPDLEDCLIATCAEKAKADYLITRDLDGFERSAVPALQPDEWLALMKEQRGIDYDVINSI